jgi:hypothetical protein
MLVLLLLDSTVGLKRLLIPNVSVQEIKRSFKLFQIWSYNYKNITHYLYFFKYKNFVFTWTQIQN